MMGNNPKLGLVDVDVHTKFGQILSSHSQDIEGKRIVHGMTERQNDGITEGQGESSIAPLFQSGAIISCNMKKRSLGFLTRFNTKQPVHSQKKAKTVQFWI